VEAATKQDLQEATQGLQNELQEVKQELKQDLRESIQALEERMSERIDNAKQDLRVELLQRMDEHAASLEESIRDSQTEMLKAFLPHQEAQRVRINTLESGITQRMDILEHRLFEIEKKLLLNPPAA
jgi:DNA-directed RNA polymerase sigma subunit (sigma70/sigma32)